MHLTQKSISLAFLLAFGIVTALALQSPADEKAADKEKSEEGFRSLFDGKSLTGWDGDPKFWSVEDGAITGKTTRENPTDGNTFIVWTGGDVSDFELHFQFRIVNGNSGVQYRSKQLGDDKWRIGGYQADFEAGQTHSGILYDEGGVAGGRGIMAERGKKVIWGDRNGKCERISTEDLPMTSAQLQAAIKKEDWNDYVITANGNHLVHEINGNVTVDVTDSCPEKALDSGLLALQLHAGPPMTVQFKDIRMKELGGKK